MKRLHTYFNSSNNWLVFVLVCTTYLLASVILNEFILVDELYYHSLGEQLAYERIEELLNNRQKWIWIQYAFIPFSVIIKIFFITLCLNVGFLMSSYQISFKNIFKTALKAELIFAMAAVLNITIFYFVADVRSLDDLHRMNWLSILNILDTSSLKPWLLYPLGLINVYELIYCGFLVIGTASILNISTKKSFGPVAGSYFSALFIWALTITLIQVSSI